VNRSPELNELAAALATAQGEIEGAKKDTENPFFKSKYADLASIWEACRAALAANGLAVVQNPYLAGIDDSGATVGVTTLLMHGSGQWLEGELVLPVSKGDAQGFGSAITYARRYALAAMVGVAPADDDGEGAVGRGELKPAKTDYQARGRAIISNAKGEVVSKTKAEKPKALTPAEEEVAKSRRRAYAILQQIALYELGDGVMGADLLETGDAGHFARETYRRKLMGDEKWDKDKAEDLNRWADAMQAVLDANTPPPEAPPWAS
jgi:hypothetical protein